MNIIMLAPPAAGKGTQSQILSNIYKIEHISIGDLIRKRIKSNDEFSLFLQTELKKGKLIDDLLISKILREKLSTIENDFILDGFPRNIAQVELLDKMLDELNLKIDAVITFDISREILLKRIKGRKVCSNCGQIYNGIDLEICDKCNNKLIIRDDDKEEIFLFRYQEYLDKTYPLIKIYQDRNILYEVDGSKDTLSVTENIKKILNGIKY